jgi:hypothetical protein
VPVALHVAHNVDSVLAARHDPALFAGLHNVRRTASLERKLLARPERVVTLSSTDADRLSAWDIAAPPLRLIEPRSVQRRSLGSARRLGFIGKASWPPNRETLHALTTTVLPAARRRLADAPPSLVIAGLGSEAFAGCEGVVALGAVDDVETFYDQIDLVVVPRGGDTTGISVKLLEAVSRGIPVIAPRRLVEDAGLTEGAITAESTEATIDAIVGLYRNGGVSPPAGFESSDDERLGLEQFAQLLDTPAEAASA